MRDQFLIITALFSGMAAGPRFQDDFATLAGHDVTLIASKTGKERLSDKASDEQRLDDCKVPEVRRTRTRPARCNDKP